MMKKLSILIVLCMLTGITYAQLEKGQWITSLNGNASLSGGKTWWKERTDRSFTVNAGAMKLVGHNVGIGVSFGSSYQCIKYLRYDAPYKDSELELEPAVVVRKYFGDYKLKPYAQVDLGWQIRRYFYDGYFSDNNAFIRPVAGISYWLSDKVSIELNAGYDWNFEGEKELRNWQFSLGFTVKLSKPAKEK